MNMDKLSASDLDELEILHRLYQLDKDYNRSFEILIKMKSPAAFEYFTNGYQFYDLNIELKNKENSKYQEKSYLLKLIQIDVEKAVFNLLKRCANDQESKDVIRKCMKELHSEMVLKQNETSENAKKAVFQELYERAENSFLD